MQTRHTLALLLAACQASPATNTGFGSTPDVTTAAGASDTGSTSASSPGTTGVESDPGGGSASSTTEPARDLGDTPDFGDGSPVGCKGKIDFLFVISRLQTMRFRQEQLAAAFPQFIDTIRSKFDDFDYHIMVVTGDDGWGNENCTEVCATPGCKVGEPCCGVWHQDWEGKPCCSVPEYPCQDLDLVTECDRTWGAGEVFPAGADYTANKPCPVDGDRRYLVKGQTDLEETFECIAMVGSSGWNALGQALTAAMQEAINDPGGCNDGFLREDALLMVTFIATNPDEKGWDSEGTPAEWAQAVLDAKHGDDKSVVMFNIGGCEYLDKYGDQCLLVEEGECHFIDRLCAVTTMFPYHHQVHADAADYGPAFAEAASLVETACAGFTPPPG
jgi:hypothetical protein